MPVASLSIAPILKLRAGWGVNVVEPSEAVRCASMRYEAVRPAGPRRKQAQRLIEKHLFDQLPGGFQIDPDAERPALVPGLVVMRAAVRSLQPEAARAYRAVVVR